MTPELKRLNFNDLLKLDDSIDPAHYDFNTYTANQKHPTIGYCTRCEDKGCHVSPKHPNFSLSHISHGSSSDDLFQATRTENTSLQGWHSENVLFIMESPSVDGWDLYSELKYLGYKKKPAQFWYWIHKYQDQATYPTHFSRGEYGLLFKSIVFTFRLKNAYLTNLVKCGLNNSAGAFKGFKEYDPLAIETCYENFLEKEIQMFQPKIIFCFGANVYNYIWYKYEDDEFPWIVMPLPHPATRSLTNLQLRHLYYSLILEGLHEAKIISLDEAKGKYGEFLTLFDRKNG